MIYAWRGILTATPPVAALILALAACGEADAPAAPAAQPAHTAADRTAAHIDGPTFPQIAQLRQQSDAVIVGRVGDVVGRELNDPEQGAGAPALPVVINSVDVLDVLKGDVKAGRSINVLSFDAEATSIEGTSAVVRGQTLVLFLDHADEGAPGIQSVPSYYYPVGQDQGVLDVRDDRARARSEIVRSVAGEKDAAFVDGLLDVPLDALKAEAAASG